MSRMYIIQDWNDSAAYSGEMIGNRLSDSNELHILPNGKANIQKYSDKPKNQKHIRDQIIPQLSTLNKLDEQEKLLEKEFSSGSLSFQEYNELSIALEKKRSRAFRSYERAISSPPIPSPRVDTDKRFYSRKAQENKLFASIISDTLKKDIKFFLTWSSVGAMILLLVSNS